jgi:hypothetical protein
MIKSDVTDVTATIYHATKCSYRNFEKYKLEATENYSQDWNNQKIEHHKVSKSLDVDEYINIFGGFNMCNNWTNNYVVVCIECKPSIGRTNSDWLHIIE